MPKMTQTTKYDSNVEELTVLNSVVRSIESQVNSFTLFRGDNSQLDMLLQNVALIFERQRSNSFFSSSLINVEEGDDGSHTHAAHRHHNNSAINSKLGGGSVKEIELRADASSTTSAVTTKTCNSVVAMTEDTLDLESTANYREVDLEIVRLRWILIQLKLHLTAFSLFAQDAPSLNLFLQNLNLITSKYSLPAENENESNSSKSPSAVTTNAEINVQGTDDVDTDMTAPLSTDDTTANDTVTDNSTFSDSELLVSQNQVQPSCSTSKRKTDVSSTALDTCEGIPAKRRKSTDAKVNALVVPTNDGNLLIKAEVEKSLTPQQKVFSTDLTMVKFLDHLNIHQLKNFRRLNWRFNMYATQALRRRDGYKVHFKFDWFTKTYSTVRLPQSQNVTQNSLKSFTKFLSTCQDFPCEYFSFTSGTLNSEDLQDFLNCHGRKIKRLHVDLFSPPGGANIAENQLLLQQHTAFYNEYPAMYLLKNLLVCQVPNLESLELDSFPTGWIPSFDRLFPEPKGKELYLRNMQSLKIQSSAPVKIVDDLFAACINLKEIRSYSNFAPLLMANKFHLMKVLSWQPSSEDFVTLNLNDTDKICGAEIERLTISLDRVTPEPQFLKSVSRVLMCLLESSSGTLKRMCFGTPVGFLADLKIPQLVKIKTIKIGGVSDLPGGHPQVFGKKYFPPGFQLGSTFPNLHHIIFEFRFVAKTERWENLFENYKSVPTVKSVDICDKCKCLPVEWMVKFVHLFPNVETLNVQAKFFHFSHDARGLWSFTKLKVLKIKINVMAGHNQFPAIDGAFTGFTEATCLSLRENSHSVDMGKVKEMRENSSIVNLKALKSLRLTFVDPQSFTRLRDLPPIITHVTGLFAFQMCKNLRVSVEAKASNKDNCKRLMTSLSPIFPFVRSHKLIQT